MTLNEEIDAALADTSAGVPSMKFEISEDGRTMTMLDRESGTLLMQFSSMDGPTFLEMSLEERMTVIFGAVDQVTENYADLKADESVAFVNLVELPPSE